MHRRRNSARERKGHPGQTRCRADSSWRGPRAAVQEVDIVEDEQDGEARGRGNPAAPRVGLPCQGSVNGQEDDTIPSIKPCKNCEGECGI